MGLIEERLLEMGKALVDARLIEALVKEKMQVTQEEIMRLHGNL